MAFVLPEEIELKIFNLAAQLNASEKKDKFKNVHYDVVKVARYHTAMTIGRSSRTVQMCEGKLISWLCKHNKICRVLHFE